MSADDETIPAQNERNLYSVLADTLGQLLDFRVVGTDRPVELLVLGRRLDTVDGQHVNPDLSGFRSRR
jgi:hypothetical protein